MNLTGRLRRNIARRSILRSIESKALEISCCKTNNGLLEARESDKILSRRNIGGSQEPPGKPAKLPPVSTLCSVRGEARRLYIILVMSFRTVSNKVIGRVFFK